jgi:hypothetical protein
MFFSTFHINITYDMRMLKIRVSYTFIDPNSNHKHVLVSVSTICLSLALPESLYGIRTVDPSLLMVRASEYGLFAEKLQYYYYHHHHHHHLLTGFYNPLAGFSLPNLEVPRSHARTHHSL